MVQWIWFKTKEQSVSNFITDGIKQAKQEFKKTKDMSHKQKQIRTKEETYIHRINRLNDRNRDVTGIYKHEKYVKCMKKISIHGKVEEPNIMGIIGMFSIISGLGVALCDII